MRFPWYTEYLLFTSACWWVKYLWKRSLIKHSCSWHDKLIVLWILKKRAKMWKYFYVKQNKYCKSFTIDIYKNQHTNKQRRKKRHYNIFTSSFLKEEKNKMGKTELHKIKTMKIKKERKNKVNLSTLLVSLPAAAHQTLTSTFLN